MEASFGEVPYAHLQELLLGPAAEFLSRPGKTFRARLVELGWALGGSADPVPVALPMALEILHAGSLIVDDIQDGSSHRRGRPCVHRELGTPLSINLANWLYFWPFALVEDLGLPPEAELQVRRRMNRVLQAGHLGQALDLGVPAYEMDLAAVGTVVRAVARLKTGQLMGLSASIGPVAAGAPPERIAALERFGIALGIGLQMLDDLGNLLGAQDPTKRHEDLRLGRPTWVWAWLSEQLDGPCFRELQQEARRVAVDGADPDTLARRLGQALSGEEQAIVHAHFEGAIAGLREALGAEAKLDDLCEEIARLERSYV